MLHHYLIIALRHLWKHRFYTVINILGLAIGMACSLLLLLHVRSEQSYDRFHDDPEEIYRVEKRLLVGDIDYSPMSAYVCADYLKEEPQLKGAVRLLNNGVTTVKRGDDRFDNQVFLFADSNYMEVFTLDYLAGDPATALAHPKGVVLSASAAKRYFGSENPLGQTLGIDYVMDVEVTGVVADYPVAAHFHFDALMSMHLAWEKFGEDSPFFTLPQLGGCYTFVRTKDPESIEGALTRFYENRVGDEFKDLFAGLMLRPLTDIHLHANGKWELEAGGSALFVDIFLMIALLVLVIASINYVNLTVALAADRSKELGIRKVVGAQRRDLIIQFLGNSVLVTLSALPIALLSAVLIRSILSQYADVDIQMDLGSDAYVWLLLAGIMIFTGIIAGSYPAIFLSRFQPGWLLSGRFRIGVKSGVLRKLLVALQLCISTTLIIGVGIMLQQLDYIRTKDVGFAKEWRIVIDLPFDLATDPVTGRNYKGAERYRQAFALIPGILGATATLSSPGKSTRVVSRVRVPDQSEEKIHQPLTLSVDFDYAEVMDLRIIQGRNFDRRFSADSTHAVLVNEALLRSLDIPDPAVGTELIYLQERDWGFGEAEAERRVQIIGVFQDMHFESLYQEIMPTILRIQPKWWYQMIILLRAEDWKTTIKDIEAIWNKVQYPEWHFEYTFLEDDLAAHYQKEEQLFVLVTLFTILTIVIACLGLFALSAFTTQQRRKEISIRKVFGAGTSNIMAQLSKEFLLLVLIALPFAVALSWWSIRIWLQTFAYHVRISLSLFLGAAIVSAIITLLAVGYHAYRSASANPVDALHWE